MTTTLAGSGSGAYADGQGAQASFYGPYGVAVDSMGTVYVADTYNFRIRKVTSAGKRTICVVLVLSIIVFTAYIRISKSFC